MIQPLTTVARLQPMLGYVSPAQQASLQGYVQAASLMAERYCNRHFAQNNYTEFRNGTLDNSLMLFNFPVNWISRIAVGLGTVMTISNTNPAYQRCGGMLLTTGTEYDGFTVQGIQLQWWASGVQSSTLIPFSGNPTLQSLANAIVALGNGWNAMVDVSFPLWPSVDLVPVRGYANCLAPGWMIQLHKSELSDYDLDAATGEIRVSDWFGASFYNYSTYPWDLAWGSPGWRSIRVEYNAGFAIIPDDVQEAVCLIAKMLFDVASVSLVADKVKLFDYEIFLKPMMSSIPEPARVILNLYRDFRASGD